MCGDSWYVTVGARIREARSRLAAPLDGDHRVEHTVRDRAAWNGRRDVELEAGDGRHEAGERDEPGGSRPTGSEPERERHDRSLREATQHGLLRRDSGLGGEVVEPARSESERLGERAGIRVADPLDGVPMGAAGRKVEWAARGHAEHSSLGIEQIEQREEVAFVGAAAVEEDEQSVGFACRRSDRWLRESAGTSRGRYLAPQAPLTRRGARARPDPSRS